MAKGIATVLKGDRHTTAKTMESIEELVSVTSIMEKFWDTVLYCFISSHHLPSMKDKTKDR